jgi:sodium-dependent dicarboxylate transporter 2/3/5
MLELLPLPVTSLIPVAVFPLLGIMPTEDVSMCYMKETCMLYLGGKRY